MKAVDIGISRFVWDDTEYYSDVEFLACDVVIMKSSVFSDVIKCIVIDKYRRFEG